ncbi:Tad domain-containing protein [Salipaludibacillus daqingensis]|uniref:Tad domain-containing protein n=1 Tax=Salipaludibacillus daqingensis TaxID=3041001 RepID=UPI00247385B9|nr:Tad domain-containing protein [Salipaludibacillus daqingensis]
MKKIREIFQKEDGNVLVLVALSIVVLLGFTAMAVDAGRMYAEKSNLQKAMDASALAGAQVYYSEEDSKVKAVEIADLNGFTIDESDVVVDETNKHVKVTQQSNIPLTFAKILGITDADIGASATAAIFPLIQSIGIAPIAVDESSIPDGTFLNCENPGNKVKEVNFNSLIKGNASEDYKTGFKDGYEEGYIDGYDKNSERSFDGSYANDNEEGFAEGYAEGFEAGEADGNDIGNKGNCGFLAIDGSGASALKEAILNGTERAIGDDLEEDTEPGRSQGPVKSAIEELISRDVNGGEERAHCQDQDTADSRCERVITVAVVAEGAFDNISGRDTLEIIAFASYWLEGMGTGQDKHRIIGHFIEMVTLGEGEEGVNEKGAYSVRLIE